MTDFGLSCHRRGFKKGGTPIFASPEVFGGSQWSIDDFSMGRIVCFLCLAYPDFLQLMFMPIEKEKTKNEIRNAIEKFEVFRKAKKCMQYGGRYKSTDEFEDISNLSPLLISRSDLISAGIPKKWFLDSNHQLGDFGNEILDQQFNLKNLS